MTGLPTNGKSKLPGRLVKWDLGRPTTPTKISMSFLTHHTSPGHFRIHLFGIGIDRRTGMVSATWVRLGEPGGTIACIYSCCWEIGLCALELNLLLASD